jgi:uncharacterized protein (TIGR02266 family)
MSEPTPKDPRGPTNLRIKFRSASLDQFIERYAVDVSRGGIFIRTREPLPVDTRLRLEFQLQDSTPLLAGEGTVVWIREHDPARENVTPGMGVRFDKLTPESQPTLEKILAEKTRLEQAGVAASGQAKGGGMAVRRPSGVFASLDANARAVLGAGLPGAPAEGAATGPESTPISAPPPPASTPAIPKTSFLASRSGAPVAPASAAQSGPFTRARNTTTRPVPVPSALFEAPTAADIDKALEVLQEAPGPAPAAHPVPAAPRYVADDASNEPTRVADIVDELVGGGSGPRGTVTGGASAPMTGRLSAGRTGEPDGVGEPPAGSAPSAASLDEPLEIADVDVEPAVPEVQAAVVAPVAPDPSKRFRAASRAYPTLNRRGRGLTAFLVVVVVLGAAAGAAVKLHLKDRFFPPAGPPNAAAPTGAAPSIAPAPAGQEPAATAPPAPTTAEGAGGAAATPPQQAAPEEKPGREKSAPEKAAPEKATAEKAPSEEKKPPAAEAKNEEHAGKHRPLHHKAETAAAAPTAATAAADKPATEKPAADKPAEQPAPEKSAEAAPADKPAAAAPAPAAPVLKVTSSPSGAQVLIDGRELGNTPFVSKEVDPSAPHTITIKKDGYEPNERMVSGLDWSRPHGGSPQTLKVNAKLRRTAAAPAATTGPAPAKENAEPEDTGGPYIKEVKPDSP